MLLLTFFQKSVLMSQDNEPTELGEKLHKWIGWGSMGVVAIIVVLLAITGAI